jgi:RHS repeat-associated protein
VQDLSYTYDPVGNVTRTADAAQSTVFFANQLVAPAGDYLYDSVYRILTASGREHIGQTTDWDDSSRRVVPLPSDPNAMRNYTSTYSYDLVGNLTSIAHSAAGGSWTRSYRYDEQNADPTNNHLTSTQVGPTVEPYSHDGNGNISSMPHLSAMTCDYRNQLRSTASQVVAGAVPATWYRYDAAKTRLRKALVRPDGSLASERVYLGAFERYREFAIDGTTITLERQTLIVPDGTRHLALVESTITDTAHPAGLPVMTTRYQFADRLGSSCVELDENAAVITYEEYYPYGSTSFQAGRSQAEVSLKRYRFTGRERDTETGFSYHGMRYYAPWLGRWTSSDPAGLVDGTGLYSYSRGNPIRLTDPDGTDGDDPPQPVSEPVAPPTSPVSSFGITPPGTESIFYSVAPLHSWATASSSGLVGQGGYVVGLSQRTQLQLTGGPLITRQETVPDTHGLLLTGQLQLNLNGDPQHISNFLVFNANVADQQQKGSSGSVAAGGSATYGREWITATDPDFAANDYNHPRVQWDVNATPAVSTGAGGVRVNTTFTSLGTGTLAGAVTYTPSYYRDALNPRGGLMASNIPRLTIGADFYATAGYGNLQVPATSGRTASRGAATGTAGVDIFGSFNSARLDSARGEGNNRITFGWAVGAFVTGDQSGPRGAFAGGIGVRGLFLVSFGRGADRPQPQRDTPRP